MPHLTLETLARLADEAPSSDEATHLEACEICRTELDAMREDIQALGMLPVVTPTSDAWPALEKRLTDEGLIRPRHTRSGWPRLMQMAAAVVLFLAGSLAGRMSATPLPPLMTADATAPADATGDPAEPPLTQADGIPTGDIRQASMDDAADDRGPAGDAARVATDRLRQPATTRLASSGFTSRGPATIEEAGDLLRETEQLYLAALTRYAELATQSDEGDPVARLAALQSIVLTTQAALDQAPADPVINGVHLATLAQRDATLAQVAAVSGERWYD